MQNASQNLARAYVQKVLTMPDLPHGAVRLGLWLVGAAEQRGEPVVEAHMTNFISGIDRNGVKVPGIWFRPETVRKSIAALEDAGIITVDEGTTVAGGQTAKLFTLHLE